MATYNYRGWTWNDPVKIDGSGYAKYYGTPDVGYGALYSENLISANQWDLYSQIKIEFKFSFVEVRISDKLYEFLFLGSSYTTRYYGFAIYQLQNSSYRGLFDFVSGINYDFPFQEGQFYTCIIELDKNNLLGRANIIGTPSIQFSWSIENYATGYPFRCYFVVYHFHPTIYETNRLDYIKIEGKK